MSNEIKVPVKDSITEMHGPAFTIRLDTSWYRPIELTDDEKVRAAVSKIRNPNRYIWNHDSWYRFDVMDIGHGGSSVRLIPLKGDKCDTTR